MGILLYMVHTTHPPAWCKFLQLLRCLLINNVALQTNIFKYKNRATVESRLWWFGIPNIEVKPVLHYRYIKKHVWLRVGSCRLLLVTWGNSLWQCIALVVASFIMFSSNIITRPLEKISLNEMSSAMLMLTVIYLISSAMLMLTVIYLISSAMLMLTVIYLI